MTLPVEYLGVVLGDLASSRRAQVKEVGGEQEVGRVISALAPLACLMVSEALEKVTLHSLNTASSLLPTQGYSTVLRTLTSGTGSFTSSFSHYEPLSQDLQNKVLKQSRGYL